MSWTVLPYAHYLRNQICQLNYMKSGADSSRKTSESMPDLQCLFIGVYILQFLDPHHFHRTRRQAGIQNTQSFRSICPKVPDEACAVFCGTFLTDHRKGFFDAVFNFQTLSLLRCFRIFRKQEFPNNNSMGNANRRKHDPYRNFREQQFDAVHISATKEAAQNA